MARTGFFAKFSCSSTIHSAKRTMLFSYNAMGTGKSRVIINWAVPKLIVSFQIRTTTMTERWLAMIRRALL